MFAQYQSLLASIINSAVETFIVITVFFGTIFPLKDKKYKTAIQMVSLFVVFALRICVFLLIDTIIFNVVFSFIIFFLILLLLYKGDMIDKGLATVVFIIFILLIEILINFFQTLTELNPLYTSDFSYHLIYIVTTRTILFWMCLIAANVVTKKYSRLPMKYWVIIITVPIASVIILNIVFWSVIYSVDMYQLYLSVTIVSLLYMNFSVFAFIDSYTKNVKLTVLESLIDKENENYKQLGVSYEQLRKIRHDFKNHIFLMKSFVKNNDIPSLEKYIDDFESDMYETAMIYTQNPAIDAIINVKGMLAKEHNINYVVKTNNIKESINISPYNICRVLGNAIDNAIEACIRIEDTSLERFVFISFQRIEKNIVIMIENSADRIKKSLDNQYESLKENKGFHGLGLSIIAEAVKELGGYMNVDYKDNVFTLHVVLPNNNISGAK